MFGTRSNSRNTSYRRMNRRHGKRGLLVTSALMTALLGIPLAALGVGGRLAYIHLNTEKIDVAYCYDREDQYQAAAFIDFSFTAQISPSQQRDLKTVLAQAFDGLPPNGKLSVFTTANGSTTSVAEPVFTLCNPAETTKEQERIGAPKSSPTVLARLNDEAAEAFDAFLTDLMAQTVDDRQQARTSPILEQMQAISRFDFGGSLDKLYAFTDGLNNGPSGRFCVEQGHMPRFAKFAEKPEYRFVAPEHFGGADIEVLLVEGGPLPQPNLPYCTTLELRTFWVDYFEASTDGRVVLTPLGYGAGQ